MVAEQSEPKQETLTIGNFQKRTMETDFTSEQIEDLYDMLESKLDNDDPVHIRKVLQGLYVNMKLSAKSKINAVSYTHLITLTLSQIIQQTLSKMHYFRNLLFFAMTPIFLL